MEEEDAYHPLYEFSIRFLTTEYLKNDIEDFFKKDKLLVELKFEILSEAVFNTELGYLVEWDCLISDRFLSKTEWMDLLKNVKISEAEIFEEDFNRSKNSFGSIDNYDRIHYVIKKGKLRHFEKICNLNYPRQQVVYDLTTDGSPVILDGCCPWEYLLD